MQNPKDDVLYAPVEWVDHSEGYSDIRYHKSLMVLQNYH